MPKKLKSSPKTPKKKEDKFPNVSQNERKEILQKCQSKYTKFLTYASIIGTALTIASISFLLAIDAGKCDKLINNILSLSCKPVDAFKDFIHKIAKSNKAKQINFDKASKHLHQKDTINNKGLISGAHEIKELIQTLKNKTEILFL